eukprot:TRINITY_DN296_c0_g1_i1.p1 TRINITY_DN296_c0_g1~~TRINITY_DN296_c0_g1_i1.p1  ORF type:complete len:205 (+),score=23.64 TRINITY_DN296_c0_g1_i1:508-1122(+)
MYRKTSKKRSIMDEHSHLPPLIIGSTSPLIAAAARGGSSSAQNEKMATALAERDAAIGAMTAQQESHAKQLQDMAGFSVEEYKIGHKKGWDTGSVVGKNQGLAEGLDKGFRAADDLIKLMPKDDPRYLGLRNDYFKYSGKDELKDISKMGATQIIANNEIGVLNIKKVRDNVNAGTTLPGKDIVHDGGKPKEMPHYCQKCRSTC